jgi:predicted nuclease of predicted toxin-antitoxin system
VNILFDECVPQRLRKHLSNHTVTTAPEAGWQGIKNGDLLKLASTKFDVFVTVDRNLSFQQNLNVLALPVIVLEAASNKLQDLEPLVPQLVKLLSSRLAKAVHRIRG